MSRRRDSVLSILGYAAAVAGVLAAICGLTLCHKPSRAKTVRVEMSSEAAVSTSSLADTLSTDTVPAASRKKKSKASSRKRVERSFLDEPVPSAD